MLFLRTGMTASHHRTEIEMKQFYLKHLGIQAMEMNRNG